MKTNTTFYNNITGLYGEQGKQWFNQLPEFLKQHEQKLDIKIHPPFDDLSFNFVAPCTLSNGNHAVFKCGVSNKESTLNPAVDARFITQHLNSSSYIKI
jgi:hypothetical protein